MQTCTGPDTVCGVTVLFVTCMYSGSCLYCTYADQFAQGYTKTLSFSALIQLQAGMCGVALQRL